MIVIASCLQIEIMPVFSYTAVDSTNGIVRGTIAGSSPRQARDSLRDQGLQIVDIKQDLASDVSKFGFLVAKRNSRHVGTFASELSTLLAVDIPVHDALETLALQYTGSFKKVVLLLKDQVESGQQLASGMSKLPTVFDRLCIKMVEVGENTGKLDVVLRQLSEFKRKSSKLRDQVLTALLYPLIVLFVSVTVSIFLMTFVVPMLLENLVEAGQSVPWPTKVLKLCSDILVTHGWWLLIVLVALVASGYFTLKTDWGIRRWYRALLSLPLVGEMSRKQEISRISLIIATLMQSGVQFLEALSIARGTSSNPFLRDSLDHCTDAIRQGRDIGTAMAEHEFFPLLVVQV